MDSRYEKVKLRLYLNVCRHEKAEVRLKLNVCQHEHLFVLLLLNFLLEIIELHNLRQTSSIMETDL